MVGSSANTSSVRPPFECHSVATMTMAKALTSTKRIQIAPQRYHSEDGRPVDSCAAWKAE